MTELDRMLDGDRAYVETYIWTPARGARGSQRGHIPTGGRLHDKFERDDAWKIAHRRTVFDWKRDTPSNEGWGGCAKTPCGSGFSPPPRRS